MASSIVPTRVSQARSRYPFRFVVRSSLRSPYGAPQIASASAPINASANVFTMLRSKSGLASSSCSSNQPDRSILGPTAIVVTPHSRSVEGTR
jgi:hypothetical protein